MNEEELIYSVQGNLIRISDPDLDIQISCVYDNTCAWPTCEYVKDYDLHESSLGNQEREIFLTKARARYGQCVCVDHAENLVSESYYWDNKLHGPSIHYAPDGTVLAKAWFIHGAQQGRNWQYYRDGQLYSELKFRDGKAHGQQCYYFPDGKLKASVPYVEGRLHGRIVQYFRSGKLFRLVDFVDHQRQGIEEQYNPDGQIVLKARFESDCPVGEYIVWHSDGKIAEKFSYKDKAWRYDVLKYSADGKIWMEGRYVSDEHYEEKIFSKDDRCVCHKIFMRQNEQWVEKRVIVDETIKGV